MVLIDNGKCTLQGKPKQVLSKIDVLEEKGIWMPQVSLLYNKLCNNNINSEVPLTVEEAHHAIKGAMGNAKITVLKKDDDEQGRPEKKSDINY